jgi:hypothetical protein
MRKQRKGRAMASIDLESIYVLAKKCKGRKKNANEQRTCARPKLFQQHINARKIGIRKTSESRHFSSFFFSLVLSLVETIRTIERKKKKKKKNIFSASAHSFLWRRKKKKRKKKEYDTAIIISLHK